MDAYWHIIHQDYKFTTFELNFLDMKVGSMVSSSCTILDDVAPPEGKEKKGLMYQNNCIHQLEVAELSSCEFQLIFTTRDNKQYYCKQTK